MRLEKYLPVLAVIFYIIFFPTTTLAQKKDKKNTDKEVKEVITGLDAAQELARQIGSQFDVPVINYEPVVKPKFWKKGALTQLGFSQVSLTNWASGGSGSLALNAYTNFYLNYTKGKVFYENRAQFAYGFVQSFETGYRKADDKIILDSKFGYRAFDKFYASAQMYFKTQFSPGFDYPSSGGQKLVSKFLAPANFSFGIGLEYKPGKKNMFSFNFAPLTTTWMIVTERALRAKYGNKEDEAIRYELGAQFTGDFKAQPFKNLKVGTTLKLFSDYLNQPKNIQVNWDFNAELILTKYLVTTLRTNLIYNDKVLIADKDGHEAPRVQFKEVLSVNFSYTFGEFKK